MIDSSVSNFTPRFYPLLLIATSIPSNFDERLITTNLLYDFISCPLEIIGLEEDSRERVEYE